MNLNRNQVSTQILQIIDGLLVISAFFLTIWLRNTSRSLLGISSSELESAFSSVFLMFSIPAIPFGLELLGFYRERYTLRAYLKPFFNGFLLSFVGVLFFAILLKLPSESRAVYLGFVPFVFALIYLRTLFLVIYQKRIGLQSARRECVLLIGNEDEIAKFHSKTSKIIPPNWESIPIGSDILLNSSQFIEKIKEVSAARVFFLSRKSDLAELNDAMEVCESMGVACHLEVNFLRASLSAPIFESFGSLPLISLSNTPDLSWSLLAKKLIDRIGATLLILVTSPLWVIAAIGIKLTSPKGKIFFKQDRAGKAGRPFRMWKFRTMHPDAEAQLAKVKETAGNEMSGPVFKLEKDPRVFSFGSFLRKTSIDELPQLLNVFIGEMSLVGPRPLPIYEVDEFQKSEYRRRLAVKPGITCTWQAGGRNTITDFEDWVQMDLDYIDNWSLLLDLKLLFLTIPAVLLSRGAS